MDLRKEFDEILEKYGFNVLVVRSDRKLRCSCWNEKTQEADRECPVCFGKGWVPVVEKHTVRSMDTSVPETLAMLGQDSSKIGGLSIPGRVYYTRYNLLISATDLIVDVDWSSNGKPIYNGGGIYEVSHVDPKRFEKGELIYNKVYVKDEPVEKQVRGIRISNVNGIKNYEIMTETKG
jgi:hypothetical protein